MRKTAATSIAKLALLSLLFAAAVVQAQGDRDRLVRVMTRNLDAGSDFGYVLQAVNDPNLTQPELLAAISNTFGEMIQSNIPLRAQGIAAEIAAYQPDLIGLQEITTLRTGVRQACGHSDR